MAFIEKGSRFGIYISDERGTPVGLDFGFRVKGGFVVAISCVRGGVGVRGCGVKVDGVGHLVSDFWFGIHMV